MLSDSQLLSLNLHPLALHCLPCQLLLTPWHMTPPLLILTAMAHTPCSHACPSL